ncbi:MAG: hypothetical protein II886_02200 [Prevotella sp.]|nr:hypothetical protein [Prevotella sp.]
MKKFAHYIGIFLIIIGTLVLLATRFHTLASLNSLLVTGLLLIVAGIVVHIWSIKHESNGAY